MQYSKEFLKLENILADKQFGFRITQQNKAFFIFTEEFLPSLHNEMHVTAISRNLAKACHCLNNNHTKLFRVQLDNS
jgi:hypothetical protein